MTAARPTSVRPTARAGRRRIAEALGFHYYDQTAANDANWSNAIPCRYPIGVATANSTGVPIDVNGRTVYAFHLHLDDSPYQPYQLVGSDTAPSLPQDRRRGDQGGRGDARRRDRVVPGGPQGGCRSRRRLRLWRLQRALTPRLAAAKAGRHPIVVAYPTALSVESEGFVDAFRVVFPDEVAKPGFTWTPTTEPSDPEDHHDRIDSVFARAPKLEVLSAGIVGEKAPTADMVVTPCRPITTRSWRRLGFSRKQLGCDQGLFMERRWLMCPVDNRCLAPSAV